MSGRLRREGNRPILQILLQILGPKRADVLGQAVCKLVRAGAALNGRFACRFFGRQVEDGHGRPQSASRASVSQLPIRRLPQDAKAIARRHS